LTKDILICSSFNGGLKIGLLCLSKKVSGITAQNYLESIGANIYYLTEWHESSKVKLQEKVDFLIVVGGIDKFPDLNARIALEKLKLSCFPYEQLIFSGHYMLSNEFLHRWPESIVLKNILDDDVTSNDSTLPEFIQDAYLKDISKEKEVKILQEFSLVDIQSTPLILSMAFRELQKVLPSPSIIFDVGGSTTDIHFQEELLCDINTSKLGSNYPLFARHVFTSYGICSSSSSTISRLISDLNCIQLLSGLYGKKYHRIYHELLDGRASEYLLSIACIFLVIRDISLENDKQLPLLKFEKAALICLTGGAVKFINKNDIMVAASSALGYKITSEVIIDSEYQWWALGLQSSIKEINNNTLLKFIA
jgi:hypothetical protein